MVKILTRAERLIEELFRNVSQEKRCPHLRKDDKGAYCAIRLEEGGKIGQERRWVCDSYSLQLWCLDKERCGKCTFYKGKPLIGI